MAKGWGPHFSFVRLALRTPRSAYGFTYYYVPFTALRCIDVGRPACTRLHLLRAAHLWKFLNLIGRNPGARPRVGDEFRGDGQKRDAAPAGLPVTTHPSLNLNSRSDYLDSWSAQPLLFLCIPHIPITDAKR